MTINTLHSISRSKCDHSMKFASSLNIMREMFLLKIHAVNEVGKLIPNLFLFFKITLYKVKTSGLHLSFNVFWWSSTWTYNKDKHNNIQSVDPEIRKFIRKNGSGTSFSTKLCVWFFRKNICHVIFYQQTKFHFLVVFTSWDIRKYMYYNFLLLRLWRHKFWNYP